MTFSEKLGSWLVTEKETLKKRWGFCVTAMLKMGVLTASLVHHLWNGSASRFSLCLVYFINPQCIVTIISSKAAPKWMKKKIQKAADVVLQHLYLGQENIALSGLSCLQIEAEIVCNMCFLLRDIHSCQWNCNPKTQPSLSKYCLQSMGERQPLLERTVYPETPGLAKVSFVT